MVGMSVSQKLELRQSQNLIMTPQLREAISLLQLSNLELSEYLDRELSQNPFLEKDETQHPDDAPIASAEPATPDDKPLVQDNRDDTMDDAFSSAWDGDSGERGATGGEASAGGYEYGEAGAFSGVGAGGNSGFDDPENSFENRISEEKSLRDHLVEQLHLATDDQRDRLIGSMMIDYLDPSGYLRHTPQEVAAQIGCPTERVEALLTLMRQFDPTGIFAHDLGDCLALQLKEINRFDPAIEILLKNLEKLAEGDIRGLSKLCKVDEDDIADMVADIRSLNPRPAKVFDSVIVQTAIPDVLMQPLPRHVGGGWKVALNQDTLPRVLVNHEYHAIISRDANNKTDKKYLSDQLTSASWLVRALDQRAQTILKVATEIVEQQDGFFLYGVEFLKPLTLRDVAETVGVHESTVSRVTMNKYIGTPRGLFELKYFFDSGVSGAGGEHAAEAVKARIKSLIDAETTDAVLSDDTLADLLGKEGIDIARRTVAKYREALNIPSSVMRRRQKRNKRLSEGS